MFMFPLAFRWRGHTPRRRCLLSVFLLFAPGVLCAQLGTDSHIVTVSVNTITLVQVSGASVNLNVTSADVIAGQDQMTVSNASTQLLWGINSSGQKITAQTSLGSPTFTLKLLAQSPTQGTAAPEFTLGTIASDLLLNVGRSSGTSVLKYTAVALASQGTGTDNHTITFTVVTQ